jgi:hypothetical protein
VDVVVRNPGVAVDRRVGGPLDDAAMTRSEEEVRVGTAQVESGRARLRKYVVTEQVRKEQIEASAD